MPQSIFATHRGTAVKRVATWTVTILVGYAILSRMVGGDTAPEEELTQTVADRYGVHEVGATDGDEARREQQEISQQGLLKAEQRQQQLVVAAYPADPFGGAAPPASGGTGDGRMTIDISSTSGTGLDAAATTTPSTGASDASGSESASPTTQSGTSSSGTDSSGSDSSDSSAESSSQPPTTTGPAEENNYDGLPDDPNAGSDTGAGGGDDAESKAAATAGAAFVQAYTNYTTENNTADKFAGALPNLTPDTRSQILKQAQEQWDRLSRDKRASQGKVSGEPSLSAPANNGKAVVVVKVAVAEKGETTNDSYNSTYTITMTKSGNDWLVDGVTAQVSQ